MENLQQRNGAIDMFRGLTMALMIAVNDVWTVRGVPHWIEHFATLEDGMGLSDIVYPMFLFAMGMSVPLALDRRSARGFSGESTLGHILRRTLALLLMGAFIVNAEGPVSSTVGYGKGVYWLLMVVGFFLVWNNYPAASRWKAPLKATGIAVLLFLAVTFRYPDGSLFQASWWGILGQIGWMYLFCAVAYLLCRGGREWVLAVLWGALCIINLLTAPMRGGEPLLAPNFIADFADALHLGNGHSVIMALGGMLTILAERHLGGSTPGRKVTVALCVSASLAIIGLASHGGWIISKGLGTLPWCMFVSAISVAFYAFLRVLERHGLTGWFKPLRPTGTATLTVYMIPYFFYSFWCFVRPVPPEWLGGYLGFAKCMLFSALCIAAAWLLEKLRIKLKI